MEVLLVHGLGRTPLSMALLAWSLAREGHRPRVFGYLAAAEPHERIVERLAARLRGMAARDEEVGLVGHSLGGLLLREALAQAPELKVRHAIMLGTPNQPSRIAARLRGRLFFRVLTGESGQRLGDPAAYEALPPIRVDCTLVAGTAGPRGRLSPFGDTPNDGVVALPETALGEAKPHTLPVLHTFMMNSPEVRELILAKLRG